MQTIGTAVIAMLILATPLYSGSAKETRKGSITGFVTDMHSSELSGATVQLLDDASREIRTTTTNEGGRFQFDGLEAGRYQVVTTLRDFYPKETRRLRVSGGHHVRVFVALEMGRIGPE
jgi:hypothetical protein